MLTDDSGEIDGQEADGDCDCSIANAQSLHELVVGLAEDRGIDVCGVDPDIADEADGSDDSDDSEVSDESIDLQIIHDMLIAQGATCPGVDGDDEDDNDETDVSDEYDVPQPSPSRFRPQR